MYCFYNYYQECLVIIHDTTPQLKKMIVEQ